MKMALAKSAAVALAAVMLAGACATRVTDGPRPPQGPGPAGTDFGFWTRDAEGAVDAAFRNHITGAWNVGEEVQARAALEADGFGCVDGNRPDGRPVPQLECIRSYHLNDDVHAWSVEFWPADKEPRARYTRTHIRNPLQNYNDKGR